METMLGQPSPRAALWARVSSSEQDTENQLRELRAFVQQRGFAVVRAYAV